MTPGDRIKERLAEYYTPEEADMWLCSPHPQLEGDRPIDLIEQGRADQVSAIIDRLDSDGYL